MHDSCLKRILGRHIVQLRPTVNWDCHNVTYLIWDHFFLLSAYFVNTFCTHKTINVVRYGDRMRQLIIYCSGCIVDLIVLLIYYSDCVDRSGSLSGGAFNQLRLATLNIVLTILYLLKTVLQRSLLQCLNSFYKSDEVF